MRERPSSRRHFLGLLAGAGTSALAGCSTVDDVTDGGSRPTPRSAPSGPADVTATVRAATGIQPSTDTSTETWLYNGEFPGPELRAREGEVIEVELGNDLSEETTIH